MKKELYESPAMEELEMQLDCCILEDSAVGLEDYNPVDWNW